MAKKQSNFKLFLVFLIAFGIVPISSATEFIYPYYYDLNQGGFTETFVMGDNYFKSSNLEFFCKDQYARSSGYVSVSETPKTCWRATIEFKDKGTIETYNLNPDDEIQLNKYMKVKFIPEGKVYYGTKCKNEECKTYYGEYLEPTDFFISYYFTITDTSFLSSFITEQDTLIKLTQNKIVPIMLYNDFASNIEGGTYVYHRDNLVFKEDFENVDFKLKLGLNPYDTITLKNDNLKTIDIKTQSYIYLNVPRYRIVKIMEDNPDFISYYVVPNIDLTVSTSIKCSSDSECREGYHCGNVTYKSSTYKICLNNLFYTTIPISEKTQINYSGWIIAGLIVFGLSSLLWWKRNG